MTSDSEADDRETVPAKRAKTGKKPARGRSWTDDETRCLLEAWLKYRDMERTVGPKKLFRDKLLTHLAKHGYGSWNQDQVSKRMENLKKMFRDNNNAGTGSAGHEFRFQKELHEILKSDYYTPDPDKIRETATPELPSTPSALNARNRDGDTVCTSSSALSPQSFRSQKAAAQPLKRKRFDEETMDLLKRDVAAREKMTEQLATIVDQNRMFMDMFMRSSGRGTPSAATVTAPASTVSSYESNFAASNCNCGACDVCCNRSTGGFFPPDFNSDQNQYYSA